MAPFCAASKISTNGRKVDYNGRKVEYGESEYQE
jgi:hypothetical protein